MWIEQKIKYINVNMMSRVYWGLKNFRNIRQLLINMYIWKNDLLVYDFNSIFIDSDSKLLFTDYSLLMTFWLMS